MRRANKKRLIPLALALALAMVGAALAVPTFNISVQQLGVSDGTQGDVIVPGGVTSAAVNWVLDTGNNPDYLSGIAVSFDQDLPAGTTVYVKLYNGGSFVKYYTYTITGDEDGTADGVLSAGTPITISASDPITSFDKVVVILQGQAVSP
ncbi:hypothetical protein [Thermococcus sp. MV11]|uniref:hypothetical protein n=1 Tax=Thermococcus sp. MV11 TaxID=1638267 RepID=UPI001430D8DE|nr:hypothetical protein [Thermococcus sp. MV11]NJE04151.1 hypothetical protein [Thermococcus sp. MV11]